MKMKSFFLIVGIFIYTKIDACSCAGHPFDLPINEMNYHFFDYTELRKPSVLVVDAIFKSYEKVTLKGGQYALLHFEIAYIFKNDNQITTKEISVYTPPSGDQCGFGTPLGSKSLLFLDTFANDYIAYASHCTANVSAIFNAQRYAKYKHFLEVITQNIDGKYQWKKKLSYPLPKMDSVVVFEMEIKNGKKEGNWIIRNGDGRVLEKRKYKNGMKEGNWETADFPDISFYPDTTTSVKLYLTFKKDKEKKRKKVTRVSIFDWTTLRSRLLKKIVKKE